MLRPSVAFQQSFVLRFAEGPGRPVGNEVAPGHPAAADKISEDLTFPRSLQISSVLFAELFVIVQAIFSRYRRLLPVDTT